MNMDSTRHGICGFPMNYLLILALGMGVVVLKQQNRAFSEQIQDIVKKSAQEQQQGLAQCDGEKVAIQESLNKATSQNEQIQKKTVEIGKSIEDADKELEVLKKAKSDLQSALTTAAAAVATAAAAT
ncbi:unnamed protein product [Meganyctiphanes norvegica]|uniref:Uncharacterized protein n=1 Tax=Meganyctiphanes norvegica TaxID=48144 RepID=A0AAV2Q2K9_MEGNR